MASSPSINGPSGLMVGRVEKQRLCDLCFDSAYGDAPIRLAIIPTWPFESRSDGKSKGASRTACEREKVHLYWSSGAFRGVADDFSNEVSPRIKSQSREQLPTHAKPGWTQLRVFRFTSPIWQIKLRHAQHWRNLLSAIPFPLDSVSLPMDSITRIVAEIQQGSMESAEKLYREFQPLVLRVVRRHLNRDMRRISDSLDFSQIVWKTLFEHASRMPQFDDPQVIAAYIARIAMNKVRGEMRAQLSLKRDVRRTPDVLNNELGSIESRDPTPSQTIMAKERLEALCTGLDSIQRQMVEQRIQGLNIDEIAQNFGISERTVRRVLKRISPSSD